MADDIVIVDYGAGNLRSVVNALQFIGQEVQVPDDPAKVAAAGIIILPGVGAAAAAMEELKSRHLIEPLCHHIFGGKPFLGVCLGLQLLFTATEEGGENHCLGVVPGRVKKFAAGLKIPHMGWNQVKQTMDHPIFADIPDNTDFYFVHSYFGVPDNPAQAAGQTEYGVPFCSMVAQDNLVATQFHPEKSGEMGLRIYRNFIKLARQEN